VPQPGTEELAAPPAEPGARPGRPRRYDPARERSLLLDAASAVLGTKGWASVTVADILGEAGLATRSFYRHFASKDELLRSLVRRDAERFAAAVTARVDAAPAPGAALVVWLDEILGFGYDRRRAQRAAVLRAATAHGALAPLAAALAAGAADGSLPGAEPEGDAPLVSAMAWDTAGRMAEVASPAAKAGLRAGLISLVERAVGTPIASTTPST
jgi:AcrR family transcriptional regulator